MNLDAKQEKTKTLVKNGTTTIASPNTTALAYDSISKSDINSIKAIYDSGSSSTDAVPPTLTVSGASGTFLAGETITGGTSGAKGTVIAHSPATTITFVVTSGTFAGTETITGQLNVDNLRIDGNTISAPSSGGITLTPAAGSNVAVGGTNTKLTATEANFTLMEATTARADTFETDTTNGDLVFSTQGTGVFDFNSAIMMAEISKPTAVADHGFIYAKNDGGTGEVYVLDAADNETKISPHNKNGEWEYYSKNSRTGKTIRINMEAMIRDSETFTGHTYIEEGE